MPERTAYAAMHIYVV